MQNRQAQKWNNREQIGRILWSLSYPFFRLSPRPFWGFRRGLLRLFGAHIGRGAHIYPSVKITMPWNLHIGEYVAIGDCAILYALGPLTIGNRTTISQYAHMCGGSHDWRNVAMPLLKMPISIGPDVWVCAGAFVGPGVVVGEKSIVAARAVVMKHVAAHIIVGGNPAQQIGTRP
jgi:putative colanic acid biosynthesis acetyltransferase WcaF